METSTKDNLEVLRCEKLYSRNIIVECAEMETSTKENLELLGCEKLYSRRITVECAKMETPTMDNPEMDDVLVWLDENIGSGVDDEFDLKCANGLFQSAIKGEWNEVLKICEKNWLLQTLITKLGDTVLHLAAYNNLEDIFEQLLKPVPSGSHLATSTLRKKNKIGNTPLHIAASVGSVRMCHTIIEKTKSTTLLSVRNNDDLTPLFSAALHGHKEAFIYFHSICTPEEGYNYSKRKDGETILHCAIAEEYFELSIMILHRYRDLVNVVNGDGMTPLHILASKPSAFKSGCELRWFENFIYHSIARTDELQLIKEADEESLEIIQDTHGGDPSSNGARKLSLNYRACFSFVEIVAKAILFIFGLNLARKVREKKTKHKWSILIMNELLQDSTMYLFSQEQGKEKEHTDLSNAPSATPILIAAKNGITEMVEKTLVSYPVAMYDMDQDMKNIVLLAVEHKQPCVYELLLSLKKKNVIKDSIFSEVDSDGNTALHLAAQKGDFNWPVPGAASQMQWEIKWYEYIKKTMRIRFLLLRNKNGKIPEEVFTETHEDLIKKGGEWLTSTSNACSVVAGLFVTVTFSTSTNVPDGIIQENKHKLSAKFFAGSSYVSFYTSLIAVIMFLSILTSGCRERDFRHALPWKLLLGLTAFYMSIASTLISFTTGHFFISRNQLKSVSSSSYVMACLLVTVFAMAVFPLYFHLAWATLMMVPQRNYRLNIARFFKSRM